MLFKIDDEPFRIAFDKADAQLGMVKNDLLAMRTNYKDMQAQIEQAKADIALNSLTVDRQQKLVVNNYTAQATLDAAQNTLIASQQKLASLKQQLAGIAVNLNGNPDAPSRGASALQECACRTRRGGAAALAYDPEGAVRRYRHERADVAARPVSRSGTTAFNIVSTDHVWVEGDPKETELTSVEAGQRVTVTVDTYPGQKWTGTVESISPASASSFSLLPAENSSGNWVKVVQRIPMRIRVENEPGQTATPCRHERRSQRRHRSSARLPEFLTDLFRVFWSQPVAEHWEGSPAPRPMNRGAITALHHSRRHHARRSIRRSPTLRCPICRAAVSASADQINWGSDVLYRCRGDHDAAVGLHLPNTLRPPARADDGNRRVPSSPQCFAAWRSRSRRSWHSACCKVVFGAALVPIAQSILLDIYTPEERGSAMALFGVSVMVGLCSGR